MSAQNIKDRYVSKAESDGVIYHTFPETLFGHKTLGDLTFDITYKSGQNGMASVNFTYAIPDLTLADSICFRTANRVLMSGAVQKIYTEADKKRWIHRYMLTTPVENLYRFFDPELTPEAVIYSRGKEYIYPFKRSAWNNYAPIGARIFQMIRVNEPNP